MYGYFSLVILFFDAHFKLLNKKKFFFFKYLERTVKMAFVEDPAKPPRDVRRRQLKFGTGTITKEALGPYRTYKPVSKTPAASAPSRPAVSSSGSGRIQVSQQHRSRLTCFLFYLFHFFCSGWLSLVFFLEVLIVM